MVDKFHIEPHAIEFACLSKACLLCGRPADAAVAVEQLLELGIALLPQNVEVYVQSLLIVYHSSLASSDFKRLDNAVRIGEPIIKLASTNQKKTWMQMIHVVHRLRSRPKSLRLHDVLVEWKAKQGSMSKWQGFKAGANYLLEHK